MRSLLMLFLIAKLLRDLNPHRSQFLCTGQYLGHVLDKLDKKRRVDLFADSR